MLDHLNLPVMKEETSTLATVHLVTLAFTVKEVKNINIFQCHARRPPRAHPQTKFYVYRYYA